MAKDVQLNITVYMALDGMQNTKVKDEFKAECKHSIKDSFHRILTLY